MLVGTEVSGLLPNGATVALQGSQRFSDTGRWPSLQSFGPAYVSLTGFRWNSAAAYKPYLNAIDAALTTNNLFWVTVLRPPSSELTRAWRFRECQLIALKASNGNYVARTTSDGALTATGVSLEDAELLILNVDAPYRLFDSSYIAAGRDQLDVPHNPLDRGVIAFCSAIDATIMVKRDDDPAADVSPAAALKLFLVRDAPQAPQAPSGVRIIP